MNFLQSKGGRVIAGVGVIVFALILGMAGWAALFGGKSEGDKAAEKPASEATARTTYTNSRYGISYSFENDWKQGLDSTVNPDNSPIGQEFGTTLIAKDDKGEGDYKMAFVVAIYPMTAVEPWYDAFIAAQSPKSVNKTRADFKGKKSVQFDIKGQRSDSKMQLIAVGEKTYVFATYNEANNVKQDAKYYDKFNAVVASVNVK